MRRLLTDLRIMLMANLWIVPVLAGLVFALFYFVAPPPPMSARMATGSVDGGYHAFGLKLREELAREGFELTLVPSRGSRDNLRQLLDGEVELALVQSGLELALEDAERERLSGLGVLYREPLWLFARRDLELTSLLDLAKRRVAVGSAGSGSGAVIRELLASYELDSQALPERWAEYGGQRAADELIAGKLDAAFFIGPAENAVIQQLAADPGLRLIELPHLKAQQARLPHLSVVEVPAGMLNLGRNVPDRDIRTLGPLATLVVGEDFHPSLTPLILAATRSVLADGQLLDPAGSYPAPAPATLSSLDEARYFYDKGLPILQRYLPFRIASLADRYIILAIPLLVLLIPLFKAVGPIYQWRIRARIYRWYKHLRETERALHRGKLENVDEEIQRFKALERELAQVQVPLSYSNELYQLHVHVRYMIQRLEELAASTAN